MTNKKTQVMMDDSTIDASKEVSMILSIAKTLRGPYKSERYKDVIIPMIILRRIECALAKTKNKVIKKYKENSDVPEQILCETSGYQFYNTCEFDLERLLSEPNSIVENLIYYIDSFSPNVQSIFEELKFKEEIKNLHKNNRLLRVVKKFSELDLNPDTIDGHKMGYMFEEIIRRYSENAEAGDHYTPREVIRLLSDILLSEGCDDVKNKGREITVLDMACGTGGMLSTAHDSIVRKNPDASVRLFGQENNPESHAICLADMLIKNQEAKNIRLADTMIEDCFEKTTMRFVIANPPFGEAWGGKDAGEGVEEAVKKEYEKAPGGRFGAGLPSTGDMQLLFMQHAIHKMEAKDGRAAIITNGSPLFSGNTTSGESQIRRSMLERDLIEAIIALPSQLFYNTDIAIYAFILSKGKSKKRKNKVQLIDATDMWIPLKRSLGKKRREVSNEQIDLIAKVYTSFNECSKTQYSDKRKKECEIKSRIFDKEEFLYKEWSVYQPLQRKGIISKETVENLSTCEYFTANTHIFNASKLEELEETNPRSKKEEKAYQKQKKGKEFTNCVIETLKNYISEKVYLDYGEFKQVLKDYLGDIDGLTKSRLEGIAMELSEIDKKAVIQKDKKGNCIVDSSTKDTEIIQLNRDVNEYMEKEVLPYIPDAMYVYEFNEEKPESSTNKEKKGAEFPFMRYFYEYREPDKADDLLKDFLKIEESLSLKVKELMNKK